MGTLIMTLLILRKTKVFLHSSFLKKSSFRRMEACTCALTSCNEKAEEQNHDCCSVNVAPTFAPLVFVFFSLSTSWCFVYSFPSRRFTFFSACPTCFACAGPKIFFIPCLLWLLPCLCNVLNSGPFFPVMIIGSELHLDQLSFIELFDFDLLKLSSLQLISSSTVCVFLPGGNRLKIQQFQVLCPCWCLCYPWICSYSRSTWVD